MATQQESYENKKKSSSRAINRLKVIGGVATFFGALLFGYFVYSTGISQILDGVSRIGVSGFAIILFIYFVRLCVRSLAWKLSVYEPYKLGFKDTLPAVIIGEALSSIIPMGILVSGTAKAVAVRKKVPLVVGLSSVATENLFYSLVTGIFISIGSVIFLRVFTLEPDWIRLIDLVIAFIVFSILLGFVMVLRQWHWISSICDSLYRRGILTGLLHNGRLQVRLFENLVYAFYRRYPGRFLPILFFEFSYHALGIAEVWFILGRIMDTAPQFSTAVLLESVSRLITIIFKLIPFVIGVDEAGAELVVETLAIGSGIGVTLAVIRKARIMSWALVGVLLIFKRGLSLNELKRLRRRGLA